MSDAADRLAQALRDLINEAVQQAVQEAVVCQPTPGDTPHVRGQAPGDPVDEEPGGPGSQPGRSSPIGGHDRTRQPATFGFVRWASAWSLWAAT
jgi:hypothetical protein